MAKAIAAQSFWRGVFQRTHLGTAASHKFLLPREMLLFSNITTRIHGLDSLRYHGGEKEKGDFPPALFYWKVPRYFIYNSTSRLHLRTDRNFEAGTTEKG